MEQGDRIQLRIEQTTGRGDGIARVGSFVVFVRGAVCGDTCECVIDRKTKNAAFAHILQLNTPSPLRIRSDCAFSPNCGGCSTREMIYAEELRSKTSHVESCLRRIGKQDISVEKAYPAPFRNAYRNKAVFHFQNGKLGFCASKSHLVVGTGCPALVNPQLCEKIRRSVEQWAAETGASPDGLLLRMSDRSGDMLAALLTESPVDESALLERILGAAPSISGIAICGGAGPCGSAVGRAPKLLHGRPYIREILCGKEFCVAPAAFFQINTIMAEKLYEVIGDYVQPAPGETVLDLYCGIGSIGLCIVPPETRLIGAEIVPESVECAIQNAATFGINAEYLQSDAQKAVATLLSRNLRPDTVIVDPPRKGLPPALCELLSKMRPRRLVYVSCDPATLARDVALLSEGGFRAARCSVVDLFPGTAHVETVVLLSG